MQVFLLQIPSKLDRVGFHAPHGVSTKGLEKGPVLLCRCAQHRLTIGRFSQKLEDIRFLNNSDLIAVGVVHLIRPHKLLCVANHALVWFAPISLRVTSAVKVDTNFFGDILRSSWSRPFLVIQVISGKFETLEVLLLCWATTRDSSITCRFVSDNHLENQKFTSFKVIASPSPSPILSIPVFITSVLSFGCIPVSYTFRV